MTEEDFNRSTIHRFSGLMELVNNHLVNIEPPHEFEAVMAAMLKRHPHYQRQIEVLEIAVRETVRLRMTVVGELGKKLDVVSHYMKSILRSSM